MIVAVPRLDAVRVMAVAIDHVVDVILVLDRGVTTIRAVNVRGIVTVANVGNASGGAHVPYYAPRQQRIPRSR